MRLSYHATQQIVEKGFSTSAVMLAATRPSVTYDNRRFPGQKRHVRDGIVAVVAGDTVVTVYANVVETPLRDDQKSDKVAVASDKRRKRERNLAERRQRDRAFTAALKSGKK